MKLEMFQIETDLFSKYVPQRVHKIKKKRNTELAAKHMHRMILHKESNSPNSICQST